MHDYQKSHSSNVCVCVPIPQAMKNYSHEIKLE